jgi:hypothetical protein
MMKPLRWAISVAAVALLWAIFIQDRSEVRVLTGVVTAFRSGELIAVANDTTDHDGIQIFLRADTGFVGDRQQIAPGASVTVKFRYVGERRPIADEVHLLSSR